MRNPKVGVVSLGCPKNTADTEVMLGLIKEAGFNITFDTDEADICLVNTCSFIQDARAESVRVLVDLASQGKELIIAGCMAQHYKEELLSEIPEARALVGTGDVAKIVPVLEAISQDSSLRVVEVSEVPNDYNYDQAEDSVLPRLNTSIGGYAYLKIAEGCDHTCTFCIIPQLRGKFRSRPIESLVKEAKILASSGIKELILVSQDSTYYGLDIYKRMALGELLEALHEIEELDWIRVMYFYPTEANDELLKTMSRLKKVVKYVDIPLQHSHPDVLSRMARPLHPEKVVARIRSILPEAAIRSTFIVGFPGETEEEFEHLAKFIEEQRFDRLGVFTYSKQEEVPSGHMPDQIPEKVKKQRRKRLMEIQHKISLERNQAQVGKTIEVLLESYDPSKMHYIGRSQWDAPGIDNLVYIKDKTNSLPIGEFREVEITQAKPYDLIAKPLGATQDHDEAAESEFKVIALVE